uniref:Uncharacterized protein n=1 Tax=Psorophora albipes TaxID=869069 RepID=T1DJ92_9DIPT
MSSGCLVFGLSIKLFVFDSGGLHTCFKLHRTVRVLTFCQTSAKRQKFSCSMLVLKHERHAICDRLLTTVYNITLKNRLLARSHSNPAR